VSVLAHPLAPVIGRAVQLVCTNINCRLQALVLDLNVALECESLQDSKPRHSGLLQLSEQGSSFNGWACL
jgi:hypothetical protein